MAAQKTSKTSTTKTTKASTAKTTKSSTTKSSKAGATGSKQKIRIKLQSFDYRLIDQASVDIVDTAKRSGARVAGPVPLPMHIRKFCVNRSPHIDKKSSDHFEIRTHGRLVDIFDPTADTVDSLKKLNLPAGVDIKIDLLAA